MFEWNKIPCLLESSTNPRCRHRMRGALGIAEKERQPERQPRQPPPKKQRHLDSIMIHETQTGLACRGTMWYHACDYFTLTCTIKMLRTNGTISANWKRVQAGRITWVDVLCSVVRSWQETWNTIRLEHAVPQAWCWQNLQNNAEEKATKSRYTQ